MDNVNLLDVTATLVTVSLFTNLNFLGDLARVQKQQSRTLPCSVEEWQRLLEHLLYVSVAKSAPACSPYEQSRLNICRIKCQRPDKRLQRIKLYPT